jgi:hypothetical protein
MLERPATMETERLRLVVLLPDDVKALVAGNAHIPRRPLTREIDECLACVQPRRLDPAEAQHFDGEVSGPRRYLEGTFAPLRSHRELPL